MQEEGKVIVHNLSFEIKSVHNLSFDNKLSYEWPQKLNFRVEIVLVTSQFGFKLWFYPLSTDIHPLFDYKWIT